MVFDLTTVIRHNKVLKPDKEFCMTNNVIPFGGVKRASKPAMDYYSVIPFMCQYTSYVEIANKDPNPFTKQFRDFVTTVKWGQYLRSQRVQLSLGVLISRMDGARLMLQNLPEELEECRVYGESVLTSASENHIMPALEGMWHNEGNNQWNWDSAFHYIGTYFNDSSYGGTGNKGLHFVYETDGVQPKDSAEWLLWLPIGEISASLYGIELSEKSKEVITRTPIWYFLTEYKEYYESIGIRFRDIL